MLLPGPVQVGEHSLQVGEFTRIGGEAVREAVGLGGQPARSLPITRVPGHHAAQLKHLTEVLASLGPHPFERGPSAGDVTRRKARARLLGAQRVRSAGATWIASA
jgi:hypothetical protein